MDELTGLLGTLRIVPHAAALALAYLLAFPIGWDREREERSAGLRTFPLVAVASCGFVQATESLTSGSPEAQARIVEGLITGIGFIGGGAIIKHGGAVQGTATAAGLWSTGAIGVAVGLGSYDVAVVITAFTLFTFRGLSPLKHQKQPDDEIGPPAG
ncbi:MgtC/SapB family protein [Salinarimonas soli]|uniref:Protein MgtC n=1 Tax=Salinarimonas soli TaxID=1638099 RepID=A0A5B2VEN3_9HYPH|nr:MgtC/SapB family protein [Salinarimonas soli]KAA2237285.1 MgtC/SapB family protein [Salinarimonas soli]